jgi:hypothetical protein
MRFFMLKSLSLLAIASSLLACPKRGEGDDELAELAADSTTTASDEALLLTATLDGAALPAVTADQAAAAIASRALARYNRPRGLRALNGTLLIEVSATADKVIADATATDFQIGASILDIAATATLTGSATSQTLAVITHTAGVGGLGFAIEHDGDYAVTWDDRCVSLEGAWSSSRGDASRSTTADITRCIDECPVGTVTRTTVGGRTIELAFDGSSTAAWSSSGGRSGTFQLACGL